MAEPSNQSFEWENGPTKLYWPAVSALLQVLVDRGDGESSGSKYNLWWRDKQTDYSLEINGSNQFLNAYGFPEDLRMPVTSYRFLIRNDKEKGHLRVFAFDIPVPEDPSSDESIATTLGAHKSVMKKGLEFQDSTGYSKPTLNEYVNFLGNIVSAVYFVEPGDLMAGEDAKGE